MDIKWNIFLKMREICKQEGVNLNSFNIRASPFKKNPEDSKKILEDYKNMLSSFSSGKPLFIFEDNGNSKYSEKEKDKLAKDIEICFEGAFREFLRDIKRKYPEDTWKNCLKR